MKLKHYLESVDEEQLFTIKNEGSSELKIFIGYKQTIEDFGRSLLERDIISVATNGDNVIIYTKDPKTTDIVNQPIHYTKGKIETRDYIVDVLEHNENLTATDSYYLGNILKYLSIRLGNKGDKKTDILKAQNYLNEWLKHYERGD